MAKQIKTSSEDSFICQHQILLNIQRQFFSHQHHRKLIRKIMITVCIASNRQSCKHQADILLTNYVMGISVVFLCTEKSKFSE